MSDPFIPCTPKSLHRDLWYDAAKSAIAINPLNRPTMGRLRLVDDDPLPHADRLAVMTAKMWPSTGVRLTVSFMSRVRQDLAQKIVDHMNGWSAYCNVKFSQVNTGGQVRVAFERDGYWSYIGTDVLHIPPNQQTMNLQGFDSTMPESEYHRVVRHETGHTLGFPHEHMRRQIVEELDPQRTVAYFLATQGWPAQMTQEQVLTPLDEASIRGTPNADDVSIMCYQLPGSITRTGKPVPGGTDIDPTDQDFANQCYPLTVLPPPPPPPPAGGFARTVTVRVESSDPGTKVTVG